MWTCLQGKQLEKTLTERTKQWLVEEELHGDDHTQNDRSAGKMSETLTRAENNNGGIATEQPVSKERNADVYDPSANALAKASGGTSGTCNHMTCYCAIA